MQGDDAEVVGQTVKLIKEDAQRLGLTWQMKTAEVTGVDPATDMVLARYDGDSESIPMISVAGVFGAGQRVYVLEVPPSGNFIIGSDEPIFYPRLGLGRSIIYTMTPGAQSSATPFPVPNSPTATVVKAYDETIIEVHFAATYFGNGGDAGIAYYARDNVLGTLIQCAQSQPSNGTSGTRQQIAGYGANASGALPAGKYSFVAYWARLGGAGIPTVDGNDMLTMLVKEVPPP
jgi:hypothetical protein